MSIIARTAGRALPALAAAALLPLLAGCGGQEAGGAAIPGGWGTLETERLTVAHPGGYREQGEGERGEHNDAAAVLTEDGRTTGMVSVQLDFMKAGDPDMAATGAEARVQLGATPTGREEVEVEGTDGARRIDYEFTSTGERGTPGKGTRMRGVMVAGLDSRGKAFLVTVDTVEGGLSEADLDRIVDSVTVR
ncbi:hypothetical protein [Streptomyces pini]|uniref:Lipoprotein n=1 Tax=Streptomyces pini TaxID=1520580 RepID=A0A1I3VJ95_9ACTN|nr:hypothetical protein [Streptomyces pini]SFJ95335.1 hypothetical protein SAMN05192584_102386 [Streptomyces pini]